MKKQIINSLLATSVIFMMAGCGSSDTTDTKKPQTKDQAPNHHIGDVSRKIVDEYNVPTGLTLTDNSEGLKIFADDDSYYIVYKHDNLGENIQFFIDTDNNSNTGIKSESGADLLVENGQLYVAGGREWKELKKYEGSSEDIKYHAGKTSDTLILSKNILKDEFFGIKAETLNKDFVAKSISPSLLTKSYYRVDMHSYEALKDMTPYIESKDEDVALTLTGNGNAIDMLLKSPTTSKHIQLFIDSDNNKETGMKPILKDDNKDNIPMWSNMGADYLINENSQLFKYNTNSKGWDYISDVPYTLKGTNILMQMQNSELQNLTGSKIKFSVITYDENWKIKFAAPEVNKNIDIPEYSL
jgi:hypothetical protein